MKTLLLMRHAKSSWKIKNIPDHERPLTKRGRRDAPRMGQLLEERELVPQLMLSSSALRARQTAELVAETAGYGAEIIYRDDLYMAEAEGYFHALQQLPDEIERVMLIGHNPGLETLLQLISKRIESLPTAVLAHLVLPIDQWDVLTSNVDGDLIEIWRPKELSEEEVEEKKEKEKEKGKAKSKDKGKKK
jgi:phosphohistidine phosphatase